MKQFRRIATPSEKRDERCLAMVIIALIMLRLLPFADVPQTTGGRNSPMKIRRST